MLLVWLVYLAEYPRERRLLEGRKKQRSVLFMVYSWPQNRARHSTALYNDRSWCAEHLSLPHSPAIQFPELYLPQCTALCRLSVLPGEGVSVKPPTLLDLSGLCHSLASGQADWKTVLCFRQARWKWPQSAQMNLSPTGKPAGKPWTKHCLESSAQCMKMVKMRPCDRC